MEERIKEIKEELNAFDDELLGYSFLVELSAYVPPDQPELMKDEYFQRGCQSRVWIKYDLHDETFQMKATSDTMLIRGVLYVMMQLYNGLTPAQIAERKIDFLQECGIVRYFSGARIAGIGSITDSIYNYCCKVGTNI